MDFYGVQFLQLLTYVRTLVTATTITSSVKGPSRKEEHQSIKKKKNQKEMLEIKNTKMEKLI